MSGSLYIVSEIAWRKAASYLDHRSLLAHVTLSPGFLLAKPQWANTWSRDAWIRQTRAVEVPLAELTDEIRSRIAMHALMQ